MKSANSVTEAAAVIALPRPTRRRRDELEFLPAALEIIETPASPAGRAIAGTIIAFLCIAILWASFSKVDIIATTQGRIIPSGRTKVIQPFETGVVRAIHVSDGAVVKAGDILIELDPTENAADETRLTYDLAQDRLDIIRIDALLADDPASFDAAARNADPQTALTARRQMEAQAAEHTAKLASIDKQAAGKQAEGREAEASIAKLQAALPLLSEQRDIRKALLANEYGSRIAYLQAQQQVVEAENGINEQTQHLESIKEALAALEKQHAEVDADYRKDLMADLSKAETQANEHGQEVAKAAQKRELRTLRAPVDGTVQQLAVHTIGGVVTPAQQLMVIVPKDAGLEIETTLANKDVGFVQKGQDVEIKVEAFTFTRYGLLHGTVINVSQDAVAAQDPSSADGRRSNNSGDVINSSNSEEERQARQAAYVARVSLPDKGIQTEQGFMLFEPGMAVTAEIKTGQRRVISYLLSPLMRYRDEAARER
jgi:hemolysin D